MATPATPQELYDAGANVLRTELDPEGTGKVDLTDGSDNAVLLSVNTAMATRNASYLADRAFSRYRTSATGDDLREVARDIWQTDKKPEAFARFTIYLQRSATAATTIPAGSRFSVPATASQPAVVFAADDVVSPSVALPTKVAVPCTSLTAGTIGNVAYADVTKIVDQLPDSGWAIYTPTVGDPILDGLPAPEVAGGGAEQETDAELQERLALLPSDASRRPGTKEGILFGVLEVPGVRYCTTVAPGDGTIVAYAGDANYQLPQGLIDQIDDNLSNGTYSTAGLLGYRGYGIPVQIRPFDRAQVFVSAVVYLNGPTYEYDTAAFLKDIIAGVKGYYSTREYADEQVKRLAEGAIITGAGGQENVQEVALTLSGDPANDISKTGNITLGSTALTNLGSTTTIAVGMGITGTGIPAGTTITAIVSSTAVTMSAAATATTVGLAVKFNEVVNGNMYRKEAADYSSQTTITRLWVDDSSFAITFAGPQTG